MTTQLSELMIYHNEEFRIKNFPLNLYFKKSGNANPFEKDSSELDSFCWNGYLASWVVEGDHLFLKEIVQVPEGSENVPDLETVFPGQADGVFANWYSGEIEAPLSDEVKRNSDGDEVAVERTLKLGFQDGILISEDVILKYPLTLGEIERGLTSTEVSVRRQFAESRDYTPTVEQIERGMLDEDGLVRMLFTMHARRVRFPFTPEQLERALTDKNKNIRDYVTSFHECKFTLFQLERALKDESPRVRGNIAMYFGEQLKSEQIARGLLDKESNVRAEFAAVRSENLEDQFTAEQIERGLTDEDEEVRMGFVDNEDVVLSPEQIQRGLKDPSIWIQLEIAARYNCELHQAPTIDPADQTIINNLYEINGAKVRKRDLFKEGYA